MQFRISEALVLSPGSTAISGFNFLQAREFECSGDLLELTETYAEWREADPQDPAIISLVENGVLLQKDTPSEKAENDFFARWEWGIPAAAFHFSLLDREILPLEVNTERQLAKLSISPPVPVFERNGASTEVVSLQRPDSALIDTMRARRTVREVDASTFPLAVLSEILYAGMAITGFTNNGVCDLPLSMTPSAGARNPYEAYVLARNVDGLPPGIYHYSALDHTLGLLNGDLPENLSEVIGGQDWADAMPCMVVLCAFLERTMWKYDDPNGYRVVLIQAGHIGQNMMLAATERGLTACPTAVLAHSPVSKLLGLKDPVLQTPVYSLSIGRPRTDAADNNWRMTE